MKNHTDEHAGRQAEWAGTRPDHCRPRAPVPGRVRRRINAVVLSARQKSELACGDRVGVMATGVDRASSSRSAIVAACSTARTSSGKQLIRRQCDQIVIVVAHRNRRSRTF